MTSLPVIKIETSEGSAFLSSMRKNGNIVALLGSAISMWKPSGIPSGQAITKALADILAKGTIAPPCLIRELIERSAFEHIMEHCPWTEDKIRKTLADVFYPTSPNPIHFAFARLLNEGIIEHIITTNYDTGIEDACKIIFKIERKPQIVIEKNESEGINTTSPTIFKIHGCASPNRRHSMVFKLRQEKELDSWKRELLKLLIHDKNLLVCGYSGLDFEICPELTLLESVTVYWNVHNDPEGDKNALTGNARRVLSATNGTVLVGDMRQMLEILEPLHGKEAKEAQYIPKSANFIYNMANEMDKWEFDKWRAGIFNGIGCALDGIRVGEKMLEASGQSKEKKFYALLSLAQSRFHHGLYIQAASTYKEAASIAKRTNDLQKRIGAELGIVESNRCSGHWGRAWFRLWKLSGVVSAATNIDQKEDVKSAIALKKALLLRPLYQIANMCGLSPIKDYIQMKAKNNLSIVATQSSQNGNWFDLQQCKMWAERFEIRFSDIYRGSLTPLNAHEGYKQLGYIIAEIMSIRDSLHNKKSIVLPEISEILEKLTIAYEVGSIIEKIGE
jgi:hypothetical protein